MGSAIPKTRSKPCTTSQYQILYRVVFCAVPKPCVSIYYSMITLVEHSFANLTERRFLMINMRIQIDFWFQLNLLEQVRSKMAKIWFSNSIFMCHKWSKCSEKQNFFNNYWLGDQLILIAFLDDVNFWSTLFSKIVPTF